MPRLGRGRFLSMESLRQVLFYHFSYSEHGTFGVCDAVVNLYLATSEDDRILAWAADGAMKAAAVKTS